MINTENLVKSQTNQIQQLVEENQDLQKINNSQALVLDISNQKKDKISQITSLKSELLKITRRLKKQKLKNQSMQKEIQIRHETIIAYEERCR